MHGTTHSASERGFTLVEVLISGLILVVGVLGLLAVFPQAYESTSDASRLAVLNQLALEKIEQLRAADYAGADLTIGTHPTQAYDSKNARYYPVANFPEDYSLRWIVENGPSDGAGTPVSGLKNISVQATYRVRYLAHGPVRRALLGPESKEIIFHTYVAE